MSLRTTHQVIAQYSVLESKETVNYLMLAKLKLLCDKLLMHITLIPNRLKPHERKYFELYKCAKLMP